MRNPSTIRHTLNVSNFAILVDSCLAMGPTVYRPTRPNLTIGAMQDALKTAQTSMATFQARHVDLSKAMEARDHGFADFDTKVTRIFNAIKACTSSKVTTEQTAQLVRKLRGIRKATPPSPPEGSTGSFPGRPNKSHISQQDLIDNTRELLQFLRATEGYGPVEADLGIDALDTWLAHLTLLIATLRATHIALARARESRNLALYAPTSGIVSLALDAKAYIRSLHGSTAPEYRRIARLEFRRLS